MSLKNSIILNGFFGKLFPFPDFIKYNAANNEILIFDKWLQDGLISAKQKLKNDWKNFYKNLAGINCFFPFTGTDKFISGTIFPGSDKSGRDFPFLLFLITNKNLFDNIPWYLFPIIFNDQFLFFQEIYSEINGNETQNSLIEKLNKFSQNFSSEEALNNYNNYLLNTSNENFWQRINPEFNDEKKYIILSNIFSNKIRSGTQTLHINLNADNEYYIFDYSFLLNIISLSKNSSFLPAVFSYKKNSIITLFIFQLKPTTENYLDIINPEINDENFFCLNEKKEFIPVDNSLKTVLDKKELNLKEMIQLLKS